MAHFLVFLLYLYELCTLTIGSELLDASRFPLSGLAGNVDDLNPLNPPDVETQSVKPIDPVDRPRDHGDHPASDVPLVTSRQDQTKLQFQRPIASLNIDYSKNEIVLKFRRDRSRHFVKTLPDEGERRTFLENNFMRFGRMPTQDFMRFGKREPEEQPPAKSIDHGFYFEEPKERYERSGEVMRDSRGDNFMRFGRTPTDFMRFGRSPSDFMRLGRSSSDFMRFGRSRNNDFMRFGRSGDNDFMRFGRTAKKLRRDNTDTNFMRFGRPDDFMRLGRSPTDTVDNSDNFMRFGRADLTRSGHNKQNRTDSGADNKKIKQIIFEEHEREIESNPMDKAIRVLYSKPGEEPTEVYDRHHNEDAANMGYAFDSARK